MKKKPTSRKASSKKSATDQTDWKRIDAMTDADIDFSDIPEATPEMFARAVLRRNLKVVPRKKQLTLILDSDVLWWFQKQGPGYEALITSILRAHMDEHQRSPA